MHKLIFVPVLLFVLLSLSACNSSLDKSNAISTSANAEPVNAEAKTESEEEPMKTKDIHALVPSGWGVLIKDGPVTAEGDLNKDGILDAAAIIEQQTSETDEAPSRALLIAFGTENESYSLSIIADNVILKADEGGIWGDPFESLSIERGSVVVSDYGGSNWRWYNKYRYRFQNDDWYLIGATMGEYFTGNATQEEANEQDYNLLTGDYIITTTNEEGKRITENGNRGKRELVKLKDFNIEDM
ncbi:hypothetical protein D3C76_18290 [compost metagenome]